MSIRSKSNKQSDEESSLGIDHPNYGSVQRPASHLSSSSTASSDESGSLKANSDADEPSRATRRKKFRIQQRHSPHQISRLSSVIPGSNSNEASTSDLVLPALDPKAQEVIEAVTLSGPLEQLFMRRSNINLSTVRQKYRKSRKLVRDEKTEVLSIIQNIQLCIKQCFNYNTYISAIKDFLLANQTIVLFVWLDLMVDLMFCMAYLVEMKQESDISLDPYWLYKWRSYDLWFFCQILTMWNMCSFGIRFFMTGHPLSVFFSFRACIEATTTLPFLVSNFIEYGQFLYVPYFLRSWVLLLRIKSAMKIRTNLQMTDKPVDPLNTKLIHLIGTLIVLLYNGMSAFQYCEVTFGSNNYTILESLYVVMVTLSTVGYGDITPNTQASRIIMMALIVISLAVLPSLITGVLDTLRKQSDGGGHVGRGAIPFILIVGSFTTEQAIAILDGFLNVENAESHLSVIFLDNNPPTEELKLMERNSMWGHRVQFLHGSVLSDDTLKRVQARYAKAIFTVSDQHAADPGKEDERNTVRLWSIFCYTVSNNVPIYTYNLSPSTAVYQKVAKEVICVREFKQYLLAMNCRCRGASTLMTNLLHQREPMNVYDEPWQAQFDDGSCNEIYMERPIDCFIGRNFGHVSWLLFKECQIILFAIKTRVEETDDCEILLNPCNNYIIKHDDICVYIAESPKEVADIKYLRPDYVAKVIDSLKFNRNRYKNEYVPNADMQLPNDTIKEKQQQQKQQPPPPPPSSSLGIASGAVGGFQFQLKLPKLPARPSMAQRSTPSYDSFSSYQWTGGSTQQNYRILKLPPDRHAMITGRRAMIARLGHTSSSPTEDTSLPQCYLLDESPKLSDVMITDTNTISGHVLVCLHREVINIFKFVYNMRSPTIKPEDLQDIVLLCQKQPKAKTFDLISMFPRVFFMVGNCRHPDDLLRAGVKRAKQVVVMSEKECLDQYERNSDSPAVMTSHILDLLLQERPKDSYTIVNLVEKSNIKYMHLLQGKDVAEEIDVFYTPAYAAGDVVADSLISNVLLSQTYYKPDIVSVLKSLCGMPCPTYDPSPGQISNDSTTTGGGPDVTSSSSLSSSSSSDRMKSQFLSSILLPQVFVGKSFACLFETLLLDYDVLPIGLLRATDEIFGNELPFVYANPVPSLILKETDMVYILASPGWSFD